LEYPELTFVCRLCCSIDRGYELTFKSPRDESPSLTSFDERSFDHLVLFSPSTKSEPALTFYTASHPKLNSQADRNSLSSSPLPPPPSPSLPPFTSPRSLLLRPHSPIPRPLPLPQRKHPPRSLPLPLRIQPRLRSRILSRIPTLRLVPHRPLSLRSFLRLLLRSSHRRRPPSNRHPLQKLSHRLGRYSTRPSGLVPRSRTQDRPWKSVDGRDLEGDEGGIQC